MTLLIITICHLLNQNKKIKQKITKEIKVLDKQLDRIKTAYIKGIVKLEDFDKEIKHIEYQKTNLKKDKKNKNNTRI